MSDTPPPLGDVDQMTPLERIERFFYPYVCGLAWEGDRRALRMVLDAVHAAIALRKHEPSIESSNLGGDAFAAFVELAERLDALTAKPST